jgi:hypothetical protein
MPHSVNFPITRSSEYTVKSAELRALGAIPAGMSQYGGDVSTPSVAAISDASPQIIRETTAAALRVHVPAIRLLPAA